MSATYRFEVGGEDTQIVTMVLSEHEADTLWTFVEAVNETRAEGAAPPVSIRMECIEEEDER